MDTIHLSNKGKTLMVAHRGVSGLEKENTMPAFVAAGNRSFYGIETDVHKTLDGKYVCIHDDTTARVAIDDMVVEKTTYDTLRSLMLCDTDGKKGRTDLRIPNLAEYISVCKRYNKYAVLELKNAFEEEDIYEICSIIEDLEYLDHVVFISFCLDNLIFLRKKYPTQPAQFLVSTFEDNLIDTLLEHKLDLDIRHKALDEEKIAACHAAGIFVNCWTVNDPEIAEKLIAAGIDCITTNILE